MIQWFKKHPEFLRAESAALSNDSNYKQIFQWRDNLFLSHGKIIVRLDKTYRFPILIIYSDATPFRLPLIFPLSREISDQGLKELASLTLMEAIERIKPAIKFYYNLRHQNSSGELCILESENLDNGGSFYGITTILQRTRDWYAGHITNQFPPDSEDVEFSSHFNFINNEIRLLYPERFLDDTLTEGDCYALFFKAIPNGAYFTEPRYIYYGAFIDGVTKGGIIEQTNVDLQRFHLHDKIKTSMDFYLNDGIINGLIKDKVLLKAQWFHITEEPSPFENFKDLVTIIGNGDFENGVKRITARCLDTFKVLPETFFFAIRFPNRKGLYEFQLFKVYQKAQLPEYILQNGDEAKIRAAIERYEKVEAIEGEKISESSFHQRNSKRADYDILKEKVVNIFGVGAIGSEVADCLAKAGAGRLDLFDNQSVKAHNAVRHLAGFDYVGKPKIVAVAEIIHNHNIYVDISLNSKNLYDLEIDSIVDNSITISTVADDNAEGYINQQMVIYNKVAFYVRALRGGKAARIFRVVPGKDACFHCLSLYRDEGKEFIEIPEDPLYPTLKNECNNPIRPASAADLKFIASLASQLFIEHLQGQVTETNHWIWSTEVINDTAINKGKQVYEQSIPIHPNCHYCNHEPADVTIPKDCVTFMQDLITKKPTVETGGVMAGNVDEKGNVNITHVSGPGPRAIQKATKFEKDVEFCQQFLDKLYVESNEKVVYVGEWHSHPSENNEPSGTDIKSLTEIAYQKEYLTDCPVMIIYSNTGAPSCTLHPAGKRFYTTELKIV